MLFMVEWPSYYVGTSCIEGGCHKIHIAGGESGLDEKTGQHFWPCKKDDELRRFAFGKQRKRFKNTVFCRRFAGVDFVKKFPHGLGRRQKPLAVQGRTLKARGHIMLNES